MIKDQETLNVLVETVARYVKERLMPHEDQVAETDQIPAELVREMKELGLFGLSIPEEYDGLGLTMEEEVMVAFELGKTSPSFRSMIGTNNGIGSQGIVIDGTDEQKRYYLPRLACGELIGSFALTEPDAGSDAGSLRTTARKDGDFYVINGTKRFITNAPEAHIFTVMARTDPEKKGSGGISAFIVEAGTPGLSLGKTDKKMGQKGSHTCDVIFDDCRVPAGNLIGHKEGIGFKTAMKVLDKGRLHIAAVCVAAADRMLNDALNYAMNRKQFGQPIAEFQLIQAMLADSKAEIYAARSMVLDAARRRDLGKDVGTEASCCKMFASEMCGRVADRSVQIHGGSGYVSDYAVERFYRDVRLFRIYEGTTQIQQLVIARNMIRAAQGYLTNSYKEEAKMKSRVGALLALVFVLTFGVSAAGAKEYRIGVELPLTGSLARVGHSTLEGITVGVEIFNRHNPSQKIKIITVDDESSPAKAVAAVEKLSAQGVVAITGGYGTNLIGPASDAANKAGLAYLTSGGVGNELTSRGLKNFFRTNGTAGYSKAMVGLFSDMGVKSVSIVYSIKESTSELAQIVSKALSAKKIKVTMHSFDPAATDFKPIINKVKLQDKSEAIAMMGYENDYVGIIRAAKVLQPPTVKAIAGVWSLATPKMASDFPDLMPNVYGTAMLPYPAGFKTAEGKEFVEAYQKLYKKVPDYLGQFGYVQAQILCESIKRAADKGILAKGGVIAEMRKTNRETLIGKVAFDETGDNPSFQQRMGQHQGQKIAIVWPGDHATAKMNFPGVPWK